MKLFNLVSDDEKLTFPITEDAEIYYRRIPPSKLNELQRKHTNARGLTDMTRVAEDSLEYSIIGWKGIGLDGKLANFEAGLVQRLPNNVQSKLVDLIGANLISESEKPVKN